MKKMTVKSRVMDFVKGMGEAKYTDIIKFIVEDVHGMEYNNKRHRGYYACAFSYNPYFLHPSKNEPRYLKKDDVTKKILRCWNERFSKGNKRKEKSGT